ncbi:MAG TPA: ferrochelatase [Caulobacteraceae bacterium]|nr:ferrochelatase [Caulobacteraceae bacterium]
MDKPDPRIAVVLFNLGGPDGPRAVRPFLEALFADPAIIDAPWIVRRPLAALIARARERSAIANYAVMGGGSPIVAETMAQAGALEAALRAAMPEASVKVVIAMRYWAPLTAAAAAEVAAFEPDEIVLAPLYPQYSTTTTASSLAAWERTYRGSGRVHALCCWYDNPGLVEAHAERIRRTWNDAGRPQVRLLFSAHGLPEKTAHAGDPYQWQVEATCAAVAERLGAGWDWQICYQSRVGPLKWLGPSTPEAIEAAGRDGLGVLIDPIAFVSEHIETLVELDRDYAELAAQRGVPTYLRAPVVGIEPCFIEGLAGAIRHALEREGVSPDGKSCPTGLTKCGLRPCRGIAA